MMSMSLIPNKLRDKIQRTLPRRPSQKVRFPVEKEKQMTPERAKQKVRSGLVGPKNKEWAKFIKRGWFTNEELLSIYEGKI